MTQVKDKDWVKVSYTGQLDSGEVVDSTENMEEALQFQVGEGQVIEGFENAVIGMTPGESKSFRLEPDDAYGDRDEEARITFRKTDVPEEIHDVETGHIVTLVNDSGDQMPGRVIQVDPESITVDLNHPLAGHPINFEVELVEIVEEPAE